MYWSYGRWAGWIWERTCVSPGKRKLFLNSLIYLTTINDDLQEKKRLQVNIIFLTRNGVPPSVSKRIQLGIDCKYSAECKNVEDLFIFTNAS